MKCQRHKIDGNECVSKRINLDDTAKCYFHAKKLCKRCYSQLAYTTKQTNMYKRRLNNRGLKCWKCGKPTGPSISGLCRNCYVELKKKGTIIYTH